MIDKQIPQQETLLLEKPDNFNPNSPEIKPTMGAQIL